MALPRHVGFRSSGASLRAHFAALAVTAVTAAGVVALDLGATANASQRLDAAQAIGSAREQGFESGAAQATVRYDRVARRMVWDVSGDSEHAVVDAETGDLVALDFKPR